SCGVGVPVDAGPPGWADAPWRSGAFPPATRTSGGTGRRGLEGCVSPPGDPGVFGRDAEDSAGGGWEAAVGDGPSCSALTRAHSARFGGRGCGPTVRDKARKCGCPPENAEGVSGRLESGAAAVPCEGSAPEAYRGPAAFPPCSEERRRAAGRGGISVRGASSAASLAVEPALQRLHL